MHVWALGLSCETPAASEKTPPERPKERGREDGKKSAKFWAPPTLQGGIGQNGIGPKSVSSRLLVGDLFSD